MVATRSALKGQAPVVPAGTAQQQPRDAAWSEQQQREDDFVLPPVPSNNAFDADPQVGQPGTGRAPWPLLTGPSLPCPTTHMKAC